MKLRRIFAALAACAIAATSVISASAADAITIKGQSDMTKDSGTIGKFDKATEPHAKDDLTAAVKLSDFGIDAAKIDAKSVVKIEVTVKADTGFCNGAIGANVAGGSWTSASQTYDESSKKTAAWSWELDKELDLASLEVQIHWVNPKATWSATGELVSYDGPGTVTISGLKLLDKDGKEVVAAAGGAAGGAGGAGGSSETPKTGASAGLALAGLALAGVAVVATKKSK